MRLRGLWLRMFPPTAKPLQDPERAAAANSKPLSSAIVEVR